MYMYKYVSVYLPLLHCLVCFKAHKAMQEIQKLTDRTEQTMLQQQLRSGSRSKMFMHYIHVTKTSDTELEANIKFRIHS